MKYSTNNVKVSCALALSEFLRGEGFDIHWHESGITQTHTSGLGAARAKITFIEEIPANPTYIVGLKSESAGKTEVGVPVLTIKTITSPDRIQIVGLGHKDSDWRRELRIEGLAASQRQHEQLADLIHDFFEALEGQELPIFDFDADPAAPPALRPAEVEFASVDRMELPTDKDATRYYIRAMVMLVYVE